MVHLSSLNVHRSILAGALLTTNAPLLPYRSHLRKPPFRGAGHVQRSKSLGFSRLSEKCPLSFQGVPGFWAGRALLCAASASQAESERTKEELIVWVQTTNQDVLTTALENGISTFLFPRELLDLADSWSKLGRMSCVFSNGDTLLDSRMEVIGSICLVANGRDLKAFESESERAGYVLMDAIDWQVIPAENLVATFQGKPGVLLAAAKSASDARVMLEALETGTHGVVLRTDSPAEVRKLMEYVRERRDGNVEQLVYEAARVVRVDAVGMGDRVCVDLCTLLEPGSGLLIGSFARTLFLVQAECAETLYINARPFRVNAGPVHSYVAVPGGRTAYLAELRTGSEVLVADSSGRTHTALVGRCKIERRPLVLVEVETSDGQRHSLLLQNAETVKLVGPSTANGIGQAAVPARGMSLPPSLAPGGGANGDTALVLPPEHILAQQAALAARSWVMNSHESTLEIDDEEGDGGDEEGEGVRAGVRSRAADGERSAESMLRPQRLTQTESKLLEWVIKPDEEKGGEEGRAGEDTPLRGSDDSQRPLPHPQRMTRTGSQLLEWVLNPEADANEDGAKAPAVTVSPTDAEAAMVSGGDVSYAGGAPAALGPSAVDGKGRRLLSHANSRVLQWVMREQGHALTSEDLLQTLDLEEVKRGLGLTDQDLALINDSTATLGGGDVRSSRQGEGGGPSQGNKNPEAPQSARSIAVSELQAGQQVYVLRQNGARHTGISLTGIRVLER